MDASFAIRILEPGMMSTVQDLGRSGWASIGVGRGGAADSLSLRAGNRLVGNADGAPAIEMTLTGGTFEFCAAAVAVLTGAKAEARASGPRGVHPIDSWAPFRIDAGERLEIGLLSAGVRRIFASLRRTRRHARHQRQSRPCSLRHRARFGPSAAPALSSMYR